MPRRMKLGSRIREPVVMWDSSSRGAGLFGGLGPRFYLGFYIPLALFLVFANAILAHAGAKKDALHYGEGVIVNIPLPEPEVEQAVEDVAQNTIIRGTKEYNKDEYVAGAAEVPSTPVFPPWKEGGKVFYKVRLAALDPRNFKESSDVGILAVRYVVQPQGDQNTILRINAIFVEDFRRTAHPSNGSVETSEYKDIQDHLAAVELVKKETADALQAKQERAAKQRFGTPADTAADHTAPRDTTISSSQSTAAETTDRPVDEIRPAAPQVSASQASSSQGFASQGSSAEEIASQEKPSGIPRASAASPSDSMVAAYQQPGQSLEQHVTEMRKLVERLVKKPGAPLQSAPFHTATTLKSLDPGTEVLLLISTPYWYGVETRDGQHGWIRRDQLEQLP
jgi:hypothetical protein